MAVTAATDRVHDRASELVNNAGMTSVSAPALDPRETGGSESGRAAEMALEQWHRSLARNLDTADR